MKKTLGPCDQCGKPVKEGDARYTAMEPRQYRHADCHDWRSPKEKLDDIQATLGKMREKLRKLRP